jgi:hypothetical protein
MAVSAGGVMLVAGPGLLLASMIAARVLVVMLPKMAT